jgi:hypothetical protein
VAGPSFARSFVTNVQAAGGHPRKCPPPGGCSEVVIARMESAHGWCVSRSFCRARRRRLLFLGLLVGVVVLGDSLHSLGTSTLHTRTGTGRMSDRTLESLHTLAPGLIYWTSVHAELSRCSSIPSSSSRLRACVVVFPSHASSSLPISFSLIPGVGTSRLPHIPLLHTRPPSSNQQTLFWAETISSPLHTLPLKRFDKKYIYSTCSKTRGTPYMAIHTLSHLSIWS